MSAETWHVDVRREDGAWLAVVRGIDGGAATDARTLAKLDTYAREVIVLGADLPDDAMPDLKLVWHFADPELQAAHDIGVELEELRRREDELTSRTHEAMRTLTAAGLSLRDIATVVRSTSGRVGQVRTAAP